MLHKCFDIRRHFGSIQVDCKEPAIDPCNQDRVDYRLLTWVIRPQYLYC